MKIKCTFPYEGFSEGSAKVCAALNEIADNHDKNPQNRDQPFSERVRQHAAKLTEDGWEIIVEGLSDAESVVLACNGSGSYSVASCSPNSASIKPSESEWANAMESINPIHPGSFRYRLNEELEKKDASIKTPGRLKI